MPLVINGATSGSTTVQATDAVTATLTLPSSTGTLLSTANPQSGGVIQVVSTTKTDTFSSSSTSYVDITGLSVSITPKFSTSKIFIIVELGASAIGGGRIAFQLLRNSTPVGVGDTSGSRTTGNAAVNPYQPAGMVNAGFTYLDSPSTTSSTTYKVQGAFIDNSGSYYINRTVNDEDATSRSRTASTITVMEIAA